MFSELAGAAMADLAVVDIGQDGHQILVAPDARGIDWLIENHADMWRPNKRVNIRCEGLGWFASVDGPRDASGRSAYGVACGYSTREGALAAAQDACERRGGGECIWRTSGYHDDQRNVGPNDYGHYPLIDSSETWLLERRILAEVRSSDAPSGSFRCAAARSPGRRGCRGSP